MRDMILRRGGWVDLPVLLFVDMLGLRSAWRHGRRAVVSKLSLFEGLVLESVRNAREVPYRGALDSDSAVLYFDRLAPAIEFGIALYRAAFECGAREGEERAWLRGVIAPSKSVARTFRDEVPTEARGITKFLYSDDLFDAINAEKSGFKGMRLLIASDLVCDEIMAAISPNVGSERVEMIAELKYSPRSAHLGMDIFELPFGLDLRKPVDVWGQPQKA